ncbi:hypothetical protein BOTCAL_0142g00210 [Botryotinia calthae]|uniref:Uncharacterized protein n=1 Tax=Botryotinia calthae TaxID=38488 RepID=A0A4Y8D5N9_9HELO|nr:hypothetical protein BOTCAL_0142g00210 [Botryotinia calthae]
MHPSNTRAKEGHGKVLEEEKEAKADLLQKSFDREGGQFAFDFFPSACDHPHPLFGGHIDFPHWNFGARCGLIGGLGLAPCVIYSAGCEWGWEDWYFWGVCGGREGGK